jgi:phenylpropionate dioxygenase-like ring-hydroxylating dioxygenase large terminal subunit
MMQPQAHSDSAFSDAAIAPTTIAIRQAPINPNHWYAIARSSEVSSQPIGRELWQQEMVLYRDASGQVRVLEDCCPHRFVKLSQGCVVADQLECAYHGWRFNPAGQCVAVPYLTAQQKLPNCRIRTFPVREQNGFIWVFPGEATIADRTRLLEIPEWDHLNYIATVAQIDVKAHFSFLIENLMDMYHGHLHQDYQAWTGAVLDRLEETSDRVDAYYQAQNYYRIDKIWSISQLFFPQLRQLHPDPLDVSYVYPNWQARLGEDFRIYCLFCPVSPTQTRAYLIHFTSLQAFPNLHKLPIAFRSWLKQCLFGSAQRLLDGLMRQDVQMIEQEQRAYLQQPDRRPYELNRTLVSVQRLIRTQATLNPVAAIAEPTGDREPHHSQ